MEKLFLVLMLFVTANVAVATTFSGINEEPKEVEKWFQELGTTQQKVTKLHFYFHEISGNTSVKVASANITDSSPTSFGSVNILDDFLTIGPEFTSKPMGRAQGLCASASFSEFKLICGITFIFTEGKYNGSTLTILGNNPALHKVRELPVIGGTGIFRLARGVAILNTYYFVLSGGNLTVEYNIIVQHY